MATTVTVYRSTDSGAPSLTNATGVGASAVLNACLVAGYGTKTAVGWTKPFTGTDKAVFRAPSGNRLFVRVLDVGTMSRFTGYETMSDVDTGTGPFSSTAGGDYSELNTVDSTGLSRPWVVVADTRTFYFFSDPANNLIYQGIMFGEIYSFKASDNYRTGLFGGMAASGGGTSRLAFQINSLASPTESFYMARSYSGVAGAINVGKHGDVMKSSGTSLPLGLLPYPNPSDSRIWLSPFYIHETADPTPRGKMRGMWQWLHPTAGIADRDTFSGTGALVGKTFMAIRDPQASSPGIYIIETSDTWDTN